MNPFFIWLEATTFSTWIRESPSLFAFPGILSCHAVGMGLAAGINVALAFRTLGIARDVPMRELTRFLPVMWFGFWLNAISGVALLIAYPTKALTNPIFYLKLTLIAIALALVRQISRRVFRESPPAAAASTVPAAAKGLAMASIASWFGAIAAGRLLAYTYSRLMAVP
jgi:hypothetical protein